MTEEILKDQDLQHYVDQVEDFLNQTIEARELSERDRDYYCGYQWNDEQIATLRARKQAPIVVNRVKPKVEGLKGLLSIRKTDIKAFPRNYKQDEKSAYAVTDALRYVYDANEFDATEAGVFEDKIVEGYGASIIEVEKNSAGEDEIKIHRIPWDRFYFDPHSRRKDFKDARYLGEMLWMDYDQLVELWPDKADEIKDLAPNTSGPDETFDDRPRWNMGDRNRRRYRIVKHYFISNGVWKMAIFTEGLFLSEVEDSPYLDEFSKPTCPIEADSAYIDRDNNRFGEVRAFIDQQDEMNHRRSKALHLLSSRQTISRTGAIKDIDALKRELKKADGHIQVNGSISGSDADFIVSPTNDMAMGQLEMYRDSKGDLDATSFNAQLSGERQSGDLSGKAIDRLQSAGAMEIDSLYKGTASWKKRNARQVWARIKQFWTAEKWIRITDDQDNLRWVGFNSQVTYQQLLEETINDKGKSLEERKGASAAYQALMRSANNPQDPTAQQADAKLKQIVSVKNKTAELDIDVILEESPDVVNIQSEQFALLIQLATANPGLIDPTLLIELSSLRNKKEVLEKIEASKTAAQESGEGIAKAQQDSLQVKNAKTFAETQKISKEAEQTAIENELLKQNPGIIPSVAA